MFYILRCLACNDSEIEKVKEKNATFKCCDCGQEFTADEAEFGQIDNYEIRTALKSKPHGSDCIIS